MKSAQEELHMDDEENKKQKYTWVTDWLEFFRSINYYSFKNGALFFMDKFSVTFTFDDLMMAMTLFVLFGDSIKLMSAQQTAGKKKRLIYILPFTY